MPRLNLTKYKQKKELNKKVKGKCIYCKKEVDSLEDHMHDKHLGKKLVKKK